MLKGPSPRRNNRHVTVGHAGFRQTNPALAFPDASAGAAEVGSAHRAGAAPVVDPESRGPGRRIVAAAGRGGGLRARSARVPEDPFRARRIRPWPNSTNGTHARG